MKAKTLRDLIRERGEPNLSNNFLRAIASTYICISKIPNLQVLRRAASSPTFKIYISTQRSHPVSRGIKRDGMARKNTVCEKVKVSFLACFILTEKFAPRPKLGEEWQLGSQLRGLRELVRLALDWESGELCLSSAPTGCMNLANPLRVPGLHSDPDIEGSWTNEPVPVSFSIANFKLKWEHSNVSHLSSSKKRSQEICAGENGPRVLSFQ